MKVIMPLALACVQYVTSLAKDHDLVVAISSKEKG
jgi:hypothetical protein